MSFNRILLLVGVLLFAGIGIASYNKKQADASPKSEPLVASTSQPSQGSLPTANRISELFNTGEPKLPIVETVTYSSRAPWLKGRSAWLVDYADQYNTPRSFVCKSLSGQYTTTNVSNGDQFNVLRTDIDFNFHLVVDVSKCRLFFYYIDGKTKERVLLKDYKVGLGRPNSKEKSGYQTPLGKYKLGSRTAEYTRGMMGPFKGQQVELIRVFGTRWIPFDSSIANCSRPAKGFGIHGCPWEEVNGQLKENITSLEGYASDGCIRLAQEDVEELYSIISTRPTIIEIVPNFATAELNNFPYQTKAI